MQISRPYVFPKRFIEENKHAFIKGEYICSASLILLVKFDNYFEHLIRTVKPMHYSKAIIRNKVGLHEMSFDRLIE